MIYIVCVIHLICWLFYSNPAVYSAMLFEMPVIFFIAGASQTYTRRRTLAETIRNRALRVLLPYYIFVAAVLIFMAAATLLHLSFKGVQLDIRLIGVTGIMKMLLTGGSWHIPYLGYTWFISAYMIISCSLPVQQRIMEKVSGRWYLLAVLALFGLWKATGINSPENIIENVLCYNFFYILGYLTYRRVKTSYLMAAAVPAVAVCAYLILSGVAVPLWEHKFPADMIFLAYCLGALCLLSLLFSRIKIKYNAVIRLWNVRGYSIYLYQSISFFIVYKLTGGGLETIGCQPLRFIILFILVFATCTAVSCITYPIERYVIKKIFNS